MAIRFFWLLLLPLLICFPKWRAAQRRPYGKRPLPTRLRRATFPKGEGFGYLQNKPHALDRRRMEEIWQRKTGLPRACGPRNDAALNTAFSFYRKESPVHRGVIARSEATWQSGSSGCSCCLSRYAF